MPMPLRDVLRDATIVAADPVVLAGRRSLARMVRWVHTSEVLDIATLLRGGELLLIGGVSLSTADERERRAYIAALAERGVSGIAIETGGRLPRVPQEMVEEAESRHLPLIELRKVVRFVEVTQSVNGLLVNESVRRLQLADRVSHALAAALADGGEVDEVLRALARETGADVVLTSMAGDVIARSRTDDEPRDTGPDGAGRPTEDERHGIRQIAAAVTTAGVTVAMLALHPRPGSDLLLLDAARDRAPEAIALALLRSRPLSRVDRDAHEFLTLTRDSSASSRRTAELAERLGLLRYDGFACVLARFDPGQVLVAPVEAAIRRGGRLCVSEVQREQYRAVVGMPASAGSVAKTRAALLDDLRDTDLPRGTRVVVGPVARTVAGIVHNVREAEATLDLVPDEERDTVVDAAQFGVARFLAALDRPDAVEAFIDEHLGDLLNLDRRKSTDLFGTLAMFLRHGGSKTDTAAALHLKRQSLYRRLDRIINMIGDPTPGTPQWAAILLAVELEDARRRRP